jgi:Protein of unknown function (DUF4245)
MGRYLLAAFVLIAMAACQGGSGQMAHPGTIAPRSVANIAERASFPVRLPARLSEHRVLNVGWVAAADGSIRHVSFDLVAGGGAIVTVDQAGDADFGLVHSLVSETTALGTRQVGAETWRAFGAPSLAGFLLVHRDRAGIEIAVSGDATLDELAAVAASLR